MIYNGHRILRLLDVFPNSPRNNDYVKPSMIITNKHGIYDLLFRVPKYLRLRTL